MDKISESPGVYSRKDGTPFCLLQQNGDQATEDSRNARLLEQPEHKNSGKHLH